MKRNHIVGGIHFNAKEIIKHTSKNEIYIIRYRKVYQVHYSQNAGFYGTLIHKHSGGVGLTKKGYHMFVNGKFLNRLLDLSMKIYKKKGSQKMKTNNHLLKEHLKDLLQEQKQNQKNYINDNKLNANIKALKKHILFNDLEIGDTVNYNVLLPTGKNKNISEFVIDISENYITLQKHNTKWRCTKDFFITRLNDITVIK